MRALLHVQGREEEGYVQLIRKNIFFGQNQIILTKLLHFQQIEKKRRDRINNSLAELRQLVPAALKKQVG